MIEIDLADIADNHENHSRQTDWWRETNSKIQDALTSAPAGLSFSVLLKAGMGRQLGPFVIPSLEMGGGVTSKSLFGLDELILFSFYARNSSKYDSAADLGANIGLHTIILCELGYSVSAYEPDPQTSEIATKLISQVKLSSKISWNQSAVVPDTFMDDEATFVRVLGNTTSSHVKGSKIPYGDLEEFRVPTERFGNVLESSALVKLDVEGLEAELFQSIKGEVSYALPDILAEIGTKNNAEIVFDSAKSLDLNIFAQKTNWGRVESANSMPTSYREGSVFISARDFMPWD